MPGVSRMVKLHILSDHSLKWPAVSIHFIFNLNGLIKDDLSKVRRQWHLPCLYIRLGNDDSLLLQVEVLDLCAKQILLLLEPDDRNRKVAHLEHLFHHHLVKFDVLIARVTFHFL